MNFGLSCVRWEKLFNFLWIACGKKHLKVYQAQQQIFKLCPARRSSRNFARTVVTDVNQLRNQNGNVAVPITSNDVDVDVAHEVEMIKYEVDSLKRRMTEK